MPAMPIMTEDVRKVYFKCIKSKCRAKGPFNKDTVTVQSTAMRRASIIRGGKGTTVITRVPVTPIYLGIKNTF
jgi:hypothetical protein